MVGLRSTNLVFLSGTSLPVSLFVMASNSKSRASCGSFYRKSVEKTPCEPWTRRPKERKGSCNRDEEIVTR